MDFSTKFSKIPIKCNNTSVINIFKNLIQHSKEKHIDVKYHFIKDMSKKYTLPYMCSSFVSISKLAHVYRLVSFFEEPGKTFQIFCNGTHAILGHFRSVDIKLVRVVLLEIYTLFTLIILLKLEHTSTLCPFFKHSSQVVEMNIFLFWNTL